MKHTINADMQVAERLTLGVLMSGVAALALSDFVSPLYWGLPAIAAMLRWWQGSRFSLSEMQASFIGWFGFVWVGLELMMGRAWVVAFTDFLLILALAVVVEAATPRNHLHRMLTGLFLMLAGAVLTDSVLYIVPLAALMWFTWRAAACLYGLHQPGGDLPTAPVHMDIRAMLAMACIALLMFVALPRFDIQSKLKPTQPRIETTGFSNQVQLGDFARELDPTVVLRIESADVKKSEKNINDFRRQVINRYWRGVVLSQYRDYGWKQAPAPALNTWSAHQDITLYQTISKPYAMAVFREASDHAYILLPNGGIGIHNISSSIQLDTHGQLYFKQAPARRLRLLMSLLPRNDSTSYVGTRAPIETELTTRHIPPAIHTWVMQTISQGSLPKDALAQLVYELRSWTYDLNAPLDAAQPLASFLQNKRGHCELYATTLALAARSLGIPSRIINGYYGGEWNQTGQFLIIRQQHAHSWVEVWLDGHWQRIDPTPPSRWQLSGVRFPQWDEVWESIKLSWYRYILEFQNSDREQLFKSILTWLKTFLPWLLLAMVSIFTSLRAYTWLHQQPWHTSNRQQRILNRWLKKHGRQRPMHMPLRMLETPQHIQDDAWKNWVQDWEMQVYGKSTPWTVRQLKRHLRALSRARC